MPRNGAGVYSLVNNTWFPATNGVLATSTDWGTFITDIQSALTQSVSSDGQTTMTGNLQMGNNKITGLAPGTANTDAVNFTQQVGRLLNVQVFSANGTYTPTTGTTSVVVEALGGGGAGGGTQATGAGQFAVGGGGGAGGYGKTRLTSGFSGASVVVGAGGTGVSGAGGNTGGTTGFGAFISATGGTGGALAGAGSPGAGLPGTGGSCSGASLFNGFGASGEASLYGTPFSNVTGQGAASNGFGRGGTIIAGNGNGVAGSGFGSGGGGGFTAPSSAATAGGAGAPGLVIVHEYA